MITAAEILVDILLFLTRRRLESVQLVNRKFSLLISSQADKLPLRQFNAVIIEESTADFDIKFSLHGAYHTFPPTDLERRLRHSRTQTLFLIDKSGRSARAWRHLLNQMHSLSACWSNATVYLDHLPTSDDRLCQRVAEVFRCSRLHASSVLEGAISNDFMLPTFVVCSRFSFGQNQAVIGQYGNYIEWLHQPVPRDIYLRRIGPLNVSRRTRLEMTDTLLQRFNEATERHLYTLLLRQAEPEDNTGVQYKATNDTTEEKFTAKWGTDISWGTVTSDPEMLFLILRTQ